MTITSQTSRWNYAGDGVSVAFVYDNKIFAASDLLVTVDGVARILVTHYSVTGVGAQLGGTVVFLAAPAAGTLVQIVRNVPAIQPVNLVDGDDFPAAVINDEFDRLTILIQQGQSVDTRVLRQPPSDTAQVGYLPTKAARAGKLFTWDVNGDPDPAPIAIAGLPSVPVSPAMAPVVGAPSIAAALTALTFSPFSQSLAPLVDAPAYRAVLGVGIGSSALRGFVVSNNGAAPNTDLDVSAGEALSADGTTLIVGGAMTKRLQAAGAWAAGNNGNGLFTGARAVGTYHFFAIRKTADGSVDYGLDTSPIAANIPAGYSKYRRLWSVMCDGTPNLRPFIPDGDYCFWSGATAPYQDFAGSGVTAAWTNVVLTVPLGIKVLALGYLRNGGGIPNSAGFMTLRSPAAGDAAPNGTFALSSPVVSPSDLIYGPWGPVQTDISGRVQYYTSATAAYFTMHTRGYIDQRRI